MDSTADNNIKATIPDNSSARADLLDAITAALIDGVITCRDLRLTVEGYKEMERDNRNEN